MQKSGQRKLISTPSKARQFGLRDMLAVFIRRRWVIAVVAGPIILFATVGTLRTSRSVVAGARVLIEPRQPENPTFENRYIDHDVLMSTAAQVAISIPVAEKAAAVLVDSLARFRQNDPMFAGVETAKDLRRILLRGIDCHQVGEANILNITFNHPNPRFALMSVGVLMKSYIDFNIEKNQNLPAIEYYNEQMALVHAGIDSLLAARAKIFDEEGFTAFRENASYGVSQIRGLERDYVGARSRRKGIEAALNGLREAIAKDPDYVPTASGLHGVKNRLEDENAKLVVYRVQYSESSEWVKRQKKVVEQIREELFRARGDHLRDLEIQLAQYWSTEESLRLSVETQKTGMAAFPGIERKIQAIDLQIDAQKDLLESLQFKRGEVRLKAGTDSRISNILPLNEPSIEMRVGGNWKLLYLALALVFSLALGFLSAMFVDNQDHRFYDRRQVEQVLEIPVLGTISRAQIQDR